MIDPEHPELSIVRQCELVSISRSGFYYQPAGETPLNLELMRLIDRQFLETPWYGSRQMARHLRRAGYSVGRKRIRRLMAKTGLASEVTKTVGYCWRSRRCADHGRKKGTCGPEGLLSSQILEESRRNIERTLNSPTVSDRL